MSKTPLVSCLCISRGRPQYLRNAVAYFRAQTYANKELIIVSSRFDAEYEEIAAPFKNEGVTYYGLDTPTELTMGELRNFAVEQAAGEYFCVWDDDDWYHRKRLETQIKAIFKSGKDASILPSCLLFDVENKEAYLSAPTLMIPGSVMCRKNRTTAETFYPPIGKQEDVPFLVKLLEKKMLYPVVEPLLYIYVFHRRNTSNAEHFSKIFANSLKLSPGSSKLVHSVIDSGYSCEKGSRLLDSADLRDELDYFVGLQRTFVN